MIQYNAYRNMIKKPNMAGGKPVGYLQAGSRN